MDLMVKRKEYFKMTARNVAMFDSNKEEAVDFIKGLQESTQLEWEALIYTANKGRKNKIGNAIRYFKYFAFPFTVFLHRKEYDNIIGWQAFYGLLYAFYCRLFHVKKVNTLLIKNFTYKPKKGVIGRIYFKFMKYIVKSEYVDVFVCTSQTFCDYCAEVFNEPKSRFVFLPFGVNDFTKRVDMSKPSTNDFILSLGRSNRDWDFLIDSLGGTKYPVRIVCDELHKSHLPKNISVYNDVWGDKSFEFIKNCKFMIIPIMDGKIGSGETVLLQAMSFAKPIIITKPSCLADDYVTDSETGLVVSKDKQELLVAVERLWDNSTLYEKISQNCRKLYEDKHSLLSYGKYVGDTLIRKNCLIRRGGGI